MSFFGSIGSFFKKLGVLIGEAFVAAGAKGLTDEWVKEALSLVKVAATMFVDNASKREWVVAALVSRGVPESVARLALELSVQLFKKEVNSIGS